MNLFSDLFSKKTRPLPKSERYYEEEPESKLKQYLNFPIFVGVALVLVVAIVISMFAINRNNNAFAMFNQASSNNFDCGSFKYNIVAGMNGTTYMKYDGSMELDIESQKMESRYHAVYSDYEYEAVVYGDGVTAYRGNYYGGKWSIEDFSEKALDFYDFYRDYRKGDFDAGAAVRFTGVSDVFNPQQLEEAFDSILKELSKSGNMKDIMRQEINVEDGVTTVSFNPDLEKAFSCISSNIGSAFSSADKYSEFNANIENSAENLSNADLKITYTIDENEYLTEMKISYTIGSNSYYINLFFSDFTTAEVEIPDGFIKEINI